MSARSGADRPLAAGRPSPVAAAAAACGVVASCLPLTQLVAASTWLPRVITVVVLVGVCGTLLRPRAPVWAVVLAQAVLAVGLPVWWWCSPAMVGHVVPTPATFSHAGSLLRQAGEVLATSTPPVPPAAGVGFLVTLAVSVLAWATDALAVTLRRPILAGLPLLVPYLTAVANSDGELTWPWFALVAAAWTALLLFARRPPPAEAADPSGRMRADRLRLGAGAAALALALAVGAGALVPTMPVRYLTDGMGRGGALGGHGTVGYSPEADMLASLSSTDDDPVFTYSSDDATAPPLRVGVTSRYADGRWSASRSDATVSSSPSLSRPPGLSPDTSTTAHVVDVTDNRLQAPHLAAPERVVRGSVTGARWAMDRESGVLVVDHTPSRYRLTYLAVSPDREALETTGDRRPVGDAEALDTRAVTATIARTADRVTRNAGTDYERAVALQRFFREGDFSYSLQLASPPAGMSAQEAGRTAVDRFLSDRRGYCVQFATAYVLMARSLGIPARMATGFLPGTSRSDGTREVRQSDAHAWPELWFEGVGWLRFEPTPGSRSGAAPSWSVSGESEDQATTPGTEDSPSSAPSASPSSAPSATSSTAPGEDAQDEAPEESKSNSTVPWLVGPPLALLALAAAAAILPLAAARRRRRALDAARGDPRELVETRWQILLDRLDDLRLPVAPTRGLLDQAERLAQAAALDTEPTEALRRLASTTQTALYSPGPPPTWSERDERLVLASARASVSWTRRLRAVLAPSARPRWARSAGRPG